MANLSMIKRRKAFMDGRRAALKNITFCPLSNEILVKLWWEGFNKQKDGTAVGPVPPKKMGRDDPSYVGPRARSKPKVYRGRGPTIPAQRQAPQPPRDAYVPRNQPRQESNMQRVYLQQDFSQDKLNDPKFGRSRRGSRR